jgi:hypothetical protein
MRWVGYVLTGRSKTRTVFWCGNLKERGHLEDLSVDGEIILLVKWALKEHIWRVNVKESRNRENQNTHFVFSKVFPKMGSYGNM